jgi:hypothetical protein
MKSYKGEIWVASYDIYWCINVHTVASLQCNVVQEYQEGGGAWKQKYLTKPANINENKNENEKWEYEKLQEN